MKNEIAQQVLNFINKSPSCFHVIQNLKTELIQNGFQELKENQKWSLKENGKYFVTRNNSSIISFSVPKKDFNSFKITASHSDSPSFKIKENPEIKSCGCVKLNVEKYGGMLMNPWFDRPLSIAGRAIFISKDSKINNSEEILINFDKDLVMIPNLAIHFSRDANDGHKINVQGEMMPIISLNENFSFKELLIKEIEKTTDSKISEDDVLSYDLFLYNRNKGTFWGADDEFIASPKLDDLECAYTTFLGFLEGTKSNQEESDSVKVHAVFDNEEVGSGTMQGADSTFLEDVLRRINLSFEQFGRTEEDYLIAVSNSFLISADNAHAVHPNFADKSDPINRPKVNEGIVIKFNASQKYTSDALSSAIFKKICKNAKVPFQIFTNNSNVAGGSTLGNISTSHVSITSVDIGLAQWAMHSPFESAGSKDCEYLIKAISEFYK